MTPNFEAPRPTHYDTGHPIFQEPGIWTVYSWDEPNHRWRAVMSTNIEANAREYAEDLSASLACRLIPCCYIVEEGK